ncbi:MAG: cyclic nucleotide-binding domain-containing protein [Candidatus Marinimicrobia bacterium]|nr:cyclic nucleotide-binding domain-containing protein [Candidatus Neomarinimicrobiota bacterium]
MVTNYLEKRTIRNFKLGQTIFGQGDPGHSMYIIIAGHVEVSIFTNDKKIILARLKQGDIFGEMALFGDKVRSATVLAETDVIAHEINRVMFNKQLEVLPKMMKTFFSILVERLKDSNKRQGAGGADDIHRQIIWLLSQALETEAEEHMDSKYIYFNKTATDISFATNVDQKTIEKIMIAITATDLASSKTGDTHERVFLVGELELFKKYATYSREKYFQSRKTKLNQTAFYQPLDKKEKEVLYLLERFTARMVQGETAVREDIFRAQLELQSDKEFKYYVEVLRNLSASRVIKYTMNEDKIKFMEVNKEKMWEKLEGEELISKFEAYDVEIAGF